MASLVSGVPSPPAPRSGLGRALEHRNFRLFFVGQGISLIGTWITKVATSWLVFRLTDSATMLGVTGMAGQLPTFVVLPFAGALVDGWDRHRVLLVTQVLSLLQSAALAVLTLSGHMTVPHLVALQVFQAVINGFDMPARQAFFSEMIEDAADLPNAIALNSSLVNGARLLGPSLAGLLIAAVGEGWCFALDAVSYLAVLAALLEMRVVPRPGAARHDGLLAQIEEGLRYSIAHPRIRAALELLAFISFVGMPYQVLMPLVATRVLGGDSRTLGFLMAASGAGALIGALHLASRKLSKGLPGLIGYGGMVLGAGLTVFAASRTPLLSMLLLVPTSAGMMIQMAATNTLLQTAVDEDKRARVLSLYAMAFFGMVPVGGLLAGALSDRIGTPTVLAVSGLACCVCSAIYRRHEAGAAGRG